jgi:hypothetical protein
MYVRLLNFSTGVLDCTTVVYTYMYVGFVVPVFPYCPVYSTCIVSMCDLCDINYYFIIGPIYMYIVCNFMYLNCTAQGGTLGK